MNSLLDPKLAQSFIRLYLVFINLDLDARIEHTVSRQRYYESTEDLISSKYKFLWIALKGVASRYSFSISFMILQKKSLLFAF